MFRRIIASMIVLSFVTMGVEADEKVVQGKHLFILSGQSNMAGHQPEEAFIPAVVKAFGKENVIGAVAISASWPIFLAAPAMDALPGGAASWRSKLA